MNTAEADPLSLLAIAGQHKQREELDEALQLAEQAYARAPNDPRVRYGLGVIELARGNYERGFPLWESRFNAEVVEIPKLPWPKWQGENIAGRHLVVWPEQGLGDKIQYCRFIPRLTKLGAKVTVLCEPALVRLFDNSFDVKVVPASGTAEFDDPDFWIPICSLPAVLGVTSSDITGDPYVLPRYRNRRSKTIRVGVMTEGAAENPNNARRCVPLEHAATLTSMHAEVVPLAPSVTGARDLLDTAQIIQGLDLVLSVCTSVAHLAGAMGAPCWIMLPTGGADWRWMSKRCDTPWYSSVRLYRQDRGGWQTMIRRVLNDISALQDTA